MTTCKTAAPDKAKPAPKDAIVLLKADHEAVSQMFDDYEKARSVAKKKALVAEICTALSVHAQIEEEIFYPAVKAALKDKLLVPEATDPKDLFSHTLGGARRVALRREGERLVAVQAGGHWIEADAFVAALGAAAGRAVRALGEDACSRGAPVWCPARRWA